MVSLVGLVKVSDKGQIQGCAHTWQVFQQRATSQAFHIIFSQCVHDSKGVICQPEITANLKAADRIAEL